MSRILSIEAALPAITVHQLDLRGQVLASSRRQVPLSGGESSAREIERDGFIALLRAAMQECLARGDGVPSLIAVTGPDDGLILSGDQGLPVRPPIAGDDSRAIALIDQWIDSGIAAAGYRRSGSAPSTGSTTTLLRHLLDTEPASLEQTERAWNGACGTAALLTHLDSVSLATASLQVIDPHHQAYDEELIDLYRLRPARHLLPEIRIALTPFEPVELLADLTPLVASGTMVHASSSEALSVWRATRADVTGNAVIHLGRTLNVMVPVTRVDSGSPPGGVTITTGRPQEWLRSLSTSGGMAALDWLLGIIGVTYQELNSLVASAPAGANGISVNPIVAGARERGIRFDPRATGRITGITENTSSADLARGMCEGIALTARRALNSEGYEPDRPVHFCGGGVRAPAFRQLLADILGRPVIVQTHPEPVALGAAIAAREASGAALEIAGSTTEEDVEPSRQTAQVYDHVYHQFLDELGGGRNLTA